MNNLLCFSFFSIFTTYCLGATTSFDNDCLEHFLIFTPSYEELDTSKNNKCVKPNLVKAANKGYAVKQGKSTEKVSYEPPIIQTKPQNMLHYDNLDVDNLHLGLIGAIYDSEIPVITDYVLDIYDGIDMEIEQNIVEFRAHGFLKEFYNKQHDEIMNATQKMEFIDEINFIEEPWSELNAAMEFVSNKIQVDYKQYILSEPEIENEQLDSKSSKSSRARLPKKAVNILQKWLYSHLGNPYPSEEEKEELAIKSHLKITQVNNWFTNARRRNPDIKLARFGDAELNDEESFGETQINRKSAHEMEKAESHKMQGKSPKRHRDKDSLIEEDPRPIKRKKTEQPQPRFANQFARLPREKVAVLQEWLQGHSGRLYPSNIEKMQLAEKSGLDSNQVNNWFMNKRTRIKKNINPND